MTMRRTHETNRTLGPLVARGQGHLGDRRRHYYSSVDQAAHRTAVEPQHYRQRHCRAWLTETRASARRSYTAVFVLASLVAGPQDAEHSLVAERAGQGRRK